MLTLRGYQQNVINKLDWYHYESLDPGYPIVEAPTGSGKSLIQAEYCKVILKKKFSSRILCVTHVKELIEQNFLELMGHWPEAPAGINCAGLHSRDYHSTIIHASVQSIHRHFALIGHVDYVLIDECHLCPVKTSTGIYRKLLDGLRLINPKIKIVGFTATHYRLDNGLLTEGENRLFTDLISAESMGMDMDELIEQRFLSPLTTEHVQTRITTEGVGKSGGDYILSQLAKKVDQDPITTKCVEEIVRLGSGRRSWLVFGVSKLHCLHIKEKLDGHGIDNEKFDRCSFIHWMQQFT